MKTYTQPVHPVPPAQWIRLPSGRFVNLSHVTDIGDDGVDMYYVMMSTNAYGIETPYHTENMPEDARALCEYMEQRAVTLDAIPEKLQ